MEFPIIIKKQEASLYFFKKSQFGLVSKDGEAFYKYGTLYDSKGDVYKVNGINNKAKAPFLKSLMYFQQMYVVDINIKKVGAISLMEMKNVFSDHIAAHKRYWQNKDLIPDILEALDMMESYEDIINYLR